MGIEEIGRRVRIAYHFANTILTIKGTRCVPYKAFRVVYAVQIGEDLWIIHAFQKKSKEGIKTPKYEIDLVHERLKRLKEILR